MPFAPDDPRLTAYALGELDPESREAVEATLRDDPEARAFVRGVEETARLLADEFRHESTTTPGLDPARRGAIEERLASASVDAPATIPIAAQRRSRLPLLVPLAAVAGIIGLAVVLTLPSQQAAHGPIQVAWNDKDVRAPEPAAAAKPAPVRPEVESVTGPSGPIADDAKVVSEGLGLAYREAPGSGNLRAGLSTAAAADLAKRGDHAAAIDPSQVAGVPPAPLAASPPRVATFNGAAAVSDLATHGDGRSMGGIGGGVVGGAGMGGMGPGGMPGGPALPGGIAPGRSVIEGFSPLRGLQVAREEESLARRSTPSPIPPAVSMPSQPALIKPSRDLTRGGRQPVVTGTQAGGVTNFSANLDRPFTQASAGPLAPYNAVPLGGQPGAGMKPGQDQNAAADRSYFDTKRKNVAVNAPGLPQGGQGQPGVGQSLADAAQFKARASSSNDGMTLPSGKYMNDSVQLFTDGVKPGQQAPNNFGFARNQANPAGNAAPNAPAETGREKGAVSESQATSNRFGEQKDQFGRANAGQNPQAAEPAAVAQAAPQPAQQVVGQVRGADPFDLPALAVRQNAFARNRAAEPPAEPGKPRAVGLVDQAAPAQPPVQLALADEAARGRLEEVRRELDGKQAEVRQLTEQAQRIRKRLDQEQTRVGREAYARFYDHPFLNVLPGNELSTFSIDVDTGSYSNVRRFLAQGQLPPPDAVRIEELLNYFTYDDPAPQGDDPFSVNVELAACPWNGGHRLARIGLKGRTIDADKRPTSNLVFLIDTSGSMADINKLPLLKAGMKLLVGQLTENDRVGIVVYSNDTRVAFPSTPCHRKAEILAAIDGLRAEGGTNGGAGIQMAYKMAEDNFIKGGTNRVILATDGDFNVGLSKEELLARSAERAKSGVFLTVLGFGEGNIQEEFMEQLADKGNGQYAYIDTIDEARKVFIHRLSGTLVTIAKDVKIQVEFNPDRVASYRLIGYENRVMEAQDFRDDKKDAGEIGAGHSVTALYEIVPSGAPARVAQADRPLKYRRSKADVEADKDKDAADPETLTVFLRYKKPDGDKATEISRGVVDDGRDFGRASADLKFSAAVAGLGMLLRGSPYRGTLTYPAVLEIASAAFGPDRDGDRKAFLDLVRQAEQIEGNDPAQQK